jgi:hypothetical protein
MASGAVEQLYAKDGVGRRDVAEDCCCRGVEDSDSVDVVAKAIPD